MKQCFTKMHGLGNSYIYLDGWQDHFKEEMLPTIAIALSSAATGIGADGLILIAPSTIADVRMRMFNRDGSEGKNCGNGLRCVAKYVYEQGYVSQKKMTIETGSGVVHAELKASRGTESIVSLDMGPPRLLRHEIPMVGQPMTQVVSEPFIIEQERLQLTAVSMGNPHAIFFLPHIALSPHALLGPKIEKDPRFPEGINVEFVSVCSPRRLQMRVWERGSGVTQACGTGACAAVVAATLNGAVAQGDAVTVELEGGELEVQWDRSGTVLMTGPATTIAVGLLKADPQWYI
jgi:diaminopimelate epimerase